MPLVNDIHTQNNIKEKRTTSRNAFNILSNDRTMYDINIDVINT